MGTGTNLGKSHIIQAISALENVRKNTAHKYRQVVEAQLPLRQDMRISAFETSARRNEPKRIESAQNLKAEGSSAGTSYSGCEIGYQLR